MKALTLHQPWATLLAIGAKHFETRNWGTDYRGSLMIHAGAHKSAWTREVCEMDPFKSVLAAAGYRSIDDLPFGAGLATMDLSRVWKVEDLLRNGRSLSTQELTFGYFAGGRFAWQMDQVKAFNQPIRMTGNRRLWNVPDEYLNQIWQEAA